jgi:hypothetical protein
MTEKEFKAYFTSRNFVFCRTPEELRKALIKFEWKKEDKMEGKTKTIHEIERKISGTIQHIVLCVDELVVALKELVPKVIEEEVVLKNGQIYKNQGTNSSYSNCYYLLIKHPGRENEWKLVSLKTTHQTWSGWRTEKSMKYDIKEEPFTLCPDAFIHVVPGDKE